MNTTAIHSESTDTMLLEHSMAGSREAYGQLVQRHQGVVCGVAYAIVGDLSRSEDVAQEAFVTAWKQLGSLRDRLKFKSWLCGITRHLALGVARKERRFEPLDAAPERLAGEPTPAEDTVSREEAALMWRALEQLPETYREPLVLFYRESNSVATVAAALELSEDAVKQRLARGREMLRGEVTALIEGALRRSRPGTTFTFAVLGALPGVLTTSAAAATLGAAGKSAAPAATKALLSAGALGALWGVLGGLLGAGLGYWGGHQSARYQRQREHMWRSFPVFFVAFALYLAPIGLLVAAAGWLDRGNRFLYLIITLIWTLVMGVFVALWIWRFERTQRRILVEEEHAGTPALPQTALQRWTNRWEGRQWQSRTKLLGLPLVDIQFGNPSRHSVSGWTEGTNRIRPARGWIALGERAHGVLFAAGNFAVGGIAFGAVAVGIVPFGGIAVGVLPVAGLALGVFPFGGGAIGLGALGGLAVGWWALGGGAFAWQAAKGGLAIAHHFAVGGKAIAAHANDAAAKEFFAGNGFFQTVEPLLHQLAPWVQRPWFQPALVAATVLALVILWRIAYRRRTQFSAYSGAT